MRLKDVAIPADAHVVDQVEFQGPQFRLGCLGEGTSRRGSLQPMRDNRQAEGRGSKAAGNQHELRDPGAPSAWRTDNSSAPARRAAH